MTKIVSIKPSNNIPETLRTIANQIESGEIVTGDAGLTLITGIEAFHLGTHDDAQAASDAIFNMNIGISKLTARALGID